MTRSGAELSTTRMVRGVHRLRWYIGGLLFLSTAINYIDRQTLSVLAPSLKTEFHWSNSDFALVVIAFRVAYAIGQTVSGRWLDRVGTRLGLSVAVAFYSASAMASALERAVANDDESAGGEEKERAEIGGGAHACTSALPVAVAGSSGSSDAVFSVTRRCNSAKTPGSTNNVS